MLIGFGSFFLNGTSREAIAQLFGWHNPFAIHAVINDPQEKARAIRIYKLVKYLERRQRRRERVERELQIRYLRQVYRDNQALMVEAGLDPGLPPLDRGERAAGY